MLKNTNYKGWLIKLNYNERKNELVETYLVKQRKTESEASRKFIHMDFIMENIQLAKEYGELLEMDMYKRQLDRVIDSALQHTELKRRIAELEFENQKLMLENKKLTAIVE